MRKTVETSIRMAGPGMEPGTFQVPNDSRTLSQLHRLSWYWYTTLHTTYHTAIFIIKQKAPRLDISIHKFCNSSIFFQISDLHDQVATIVGSVPSVVYKHLVDAHQISSTALVSYLSHMPSSVIAGVPDKLQKLLTSILDLCQLCDKVAMSAKEGEGLDDGSDEGSDVSYVESNTTQYDTLTSQDNVVSRNHVKLASVPSAEKFIAPLKMFHIKSFSIL
jgi:hypothetical protein